MSFCMNGGRNLLPQGLISMTTFMTEGVVGKAFDATRFPIQFQLA